MKGMTKIGHTYPGRIDNDEPGKISTFGMPEG